MELMTFKAWCVHLESDLTHANTWEFLPSWIQRQIQSMSPVTGSLLLKKQATGKLRERRKRREKTQLVQLGTEVQGTVP